MSAETAHILLVEDNAQDARVLSEALQHALPRPFQMTHVFRLSEALESIAKQAFDAVLLDLSLPDSNGIRTVVLTASQAPATPVVVLLDHPNDTLSELALKEGAQDYIVKGQIESGALARTLRNAMIRHAAAETWIAQRVALAKSRLLHSRQRLIAVHEQARREIAARLRDTVHERILTFKRQLRKFPVSFPINDGTTGQFSGLIDGTARAIEEQMAVLSHQLSPPIHEIGLGRALESLRERYGPRPTIAFDFHQTLTASISASDTMAERTRLAVYRITEEAVANAVKHAGATAIEVRLVPCKDEWLRLTIQDNGQGFDTSCSTEGLGLGMMHDYAEAADGKCLVHSETGTGTEVTVELPLIQTCARCLVSSDH